MDCIEKEKKIVPLFMPSIKKKKSGRKKSCAIPYDT